MKAMIASDLVTMKNSMAQLVVVCLVVAAAMAVMTKNLLVCMSALCAMVPFMYLFTISAYDEMNGWERFRLTLPISRSQVVFGRYVGLLIVEVLCDVLALAFAGLITVVIGALPASMQMPELTFQGNGPGLVFGVCLRVSALILFVAALSLPFFMRYGMTKGTRLAPIVLILLFSFGLWAVSESGFMNAVLPGAWETLQQLFSHEDASSWVASMIIIGVALGVYAVSAAISAKLYQRRQF